MWTCRDPLLSQVYRFVQNGWPSTKLLPDFQPFITKRNELFIADNCLLWGSHLAIPHSGRKLLLEKLHEAHSGISRMKSRARMLMWWPNIDKDIENEVSHVQFAKSAGLFHLLLLYSHGHGLMNLGQDFTLAMQNL